MKRPDDFGHVLSVIVSHLQLLPIYVRRHPVRRQSVQGPTVGLVATISGLYARDIRKRKCGFSDDQIQLWKIVFDHVREEESLAVIITDPINAFPMQHQLEDA